MEEEEIQLSIGKNLFNTIQDVCDFTPLESDMYEIIISVQEDNKKLLDKLQSENEELERKIEEVKQKGFNMTHNKSSNRSRQIGKGYVRACKEIQELLNQSK